MNLDAFALSPINGQSARILRQGGTSINPDKLNAHDLNGIRISLQRRRKEVALQLGADNSRKRKNLTWRLQQRAKKCNTRHYDEDEETFLLKTEYTRLGGQIYDVMQDIRELNK